MDEEWTDKATHFFFIGQLVLRQIYNFPGFFCSTWQILDSQWLGPLLYVTTIPVLTPYFNPLPDDKF